MRSHHSLAALLLGFALGNLAIAGDDELTPQQIASHPAVLGAAEIFGAWVEGTRFYEEVPGISAGIVYDQQMIWAGNYGYSNLAAQRPMDSDTIFSICSISKLFTSIGIMQLRDAGRLRLGDPVADHLDWYDIRLAHEGSAPVTIETLLTHSSGLPRESDFPYWVGPDFPFPTREEMIARLEAQETLYPASTYFQYSNLALTLAGEVVAEVSGEAYEDYVRNHILSPLALADTRPRYPDELRGEQLAIGYRGKHRVGSRGEVEPFFTRGITAAAGFTSTVNDLAKFAMWQFRVLGAGDASVLRPSTLKDMQRVHWVDPDWETTWGIGFNVRRVDEMTLAGHGGGCPGYITQFLTNPKDRIAVIVLTNAGDGPAERLALGGMKLLAETIEEATELPETTPDYSAYEGNFEARPWGGETAIRQAGDELLVIDIPNEELAESLIRLKHEQGDTFRRIDDDDEPREPWRFELGADGKAERVWVHSFVMTRVQMP